MYNDTRYYEDNKQISIRLPLNRIQTISLILGIALVLGALSLLYLWTDIEPEQRAITYDVVPVTLLNFGDGDGTGRSKGNLTEEGILHKGKSPESGLHDAEVGSNTRGNNSNTETDITISSNIKPGDGTGTENDGVGAKDVGGLEGSSVGSGLGSRGSGAGLGNGFGDIEWGGGGGNRIVLSKKPPRFPSNANVSGDVILKFWVKPDGTVSKIVVVKKSDPTLENSAIDALRQWRFNAIKDSLDMVGIIPFKFRLR